jgi:alpha-ketoglutarate-dependent taurine dioxygenase
MLNHRETLARGIGRFALAEGIWEGLQTQIVGIIDRFYGESVESGFYPHFNEVAVRRSLLAEVPALNALRQIVAALMEGSYCAIILDRLGLKDMPARDRDRLLFALSLALGYPTPTDPRRGKLLWPVKPRRLPTGHFATYSEHSDRAELHTDTQYYPDPERYFLLYVVRSAQCGGGRSLLCDGREVEAVLHDTVVGREAYRILSTFPFPFRIPTTFTQAGTVGDVETILAPIFGRKPSIRFRYDTIQQGFQARPELDVPAARQALNVLLEILVGSVPVVDYPLPDDSLLICDNHTALHGRTPFRDSKRHLIRIRLATRSLAARMAAEGRETDVDVTNLTPPPAIRAAFV